MGSEGMRVMHVGGKQRRILPKPIRDLSEEEAASVELTTVSGMPK